MLVYVTVFNNRKVVVEMDENMTLGDLICKCIDVDASLLRIIYCYKQLTDNERTLKDYGIQHESELYIVLKLSGGGIPFIDATVYCTKGRATVEYKIQLQINVPIGSLKNNLAHSLGIIPSRQKWTYNGSVLRDNFTLLTYHATSGMVLHVEDSG